MVGRELEDSRQKRRGKGRNLYVLRTPGMERFVGRIIKN